MSSSGATIKQRLLSGGIRVIIGKGLTVLPLLIVNALIARLLGPETMGGYFLALSQFHYLSYCRGPTAGPQGL